MSSTVIFNTARGGSYRPFHGWFSQQHWQCGNPHFSKTRGFQEESRGKYSKCAQNCTEEAQVDSSSNSEAPRNFRAPRSSKAPRTEGAKYLPSSEFLNKKVIFVSHTKLQNCRPAETFLNKLEENNFRSRSAPDCIWLQSRIVRNTSSSQTPTGAQILNTREGANRKRNKGAGEKGSHQTGFPSTKPILKQLVSCKDRPVINLKNLNGIVDYQHFKMEDISTLKDLIQPNDWMMKLDLKDAYFFVPIHKDHRKYFRFQWINSIKEFSCLPFTYGPAPRRFTKLFRPVLALLRKMGMRLVIYIDDIIILNQSCTALLQDRDSVIFLLQCLRFVINWTKYQLEPTQSLEYLGFLEFCLDDPIFTRTESREYSKGVPLSLEQPIIINSSDIRTSRHANSICSSSVASPLHYRRLQMAQIEFIIRFQSYDTTVTLPASCREEVQWWIHNLQNNNSKPNIMPPPDLTITSDASKIGWGATCNTARTGGQ